MAEIVPRSLYSEPPATRLSGRDDRLRKGVTQDAGLKARCYKSKPRVTLERSASLLRRAGGRRTQEKLREVQLQRWSRAGFRGDGCFENDNNYWQCGGWVQFETVVSYMHQFAWVSR